MRAALPVFLLATDYCLLSTSLYTVRMSETKGTLYLVATPIGNLEDVTRRALRVLAEADVVACEDTRHTRRLLEHFGIRARTVSYHEHNERERAEELARLIEEGRTVALVSDAGTPGINDPGYRVVRACVERNLTVVPVPGPTALVAALTASGRGRALPLSFA